MQIETDGKNLILIPETEMDYYDLGCYTIQNIPYNLDVDITTKKIKAMMISKKHLLKILLHKQI